MEFAGALNAAGITAADGIESAEAGTLRCDAIGRAGPAASKLAGALALIGLGTPSRELRGGLCAEGATRASASLDTPSASALRGSPNEPSGVDGGAGASAATRRWMGCCWSAPTVRGRCQPSLGHHAPPMGATADRADATTAFQSA